MEKSFLLRSLSFALVLLALFFPVPFLLAHMSMDGPWFDPFLGTVVWGAFLQGFASALISLLLGVLGAFGLLSLGQKRSRRQLALFYGMLILPGFVPPIIVVALVSKMFGFLPLGLFGVVFFHVLMNLGLVSVVFHRILLKKTNLWVRDALVANVKKIKIISGLMSALRFDLAWLFFYFFVLYFFSFSIPFLVGGSQFGGVEVFIYEKVMFFGQWGEAIYYSMIFFLSMLGLSSLLVGRDNIDFKPLRSNTFFIEAVAIPWGWVVPVLPFFLIIGGLVLSTSQIPMPSVFSALSLSIRGSLIVALLTGLGTFTLLTLVAFSFCSDRWSRFLLAMVHPGWVVVGFAFLLLGGVGQVSDFLKIGSALTILYFPFLFRLAFYENLQHLRQQVLVARSFPVSWLKIFSQVLWPQCLSVMALLSGIAAVWACGDFAMTGLLSQSTEVSTLASDMKGLLANYRIEQSLLYLWPLVVVSALVFFLFQGLAYVGSKKTSS